MQTRRQPEADEATPSEPARDVNAALDDLEVRFLLDPDTTLDPEPPVEGTP